MEDETNETMTLPDHDFSFGPLPVMELGQSSHPLFTVMPLQPSLKRFRDNVSGSLSLPFFSSHPLSLYSEQEASAHQQKKWKPSNVQTSQVVEANNGGEISRESAQNESNNSYMDWC